MSRTPPARGAPARLLAASLLAASMAAASLAGCASLPVLLGPAGASGGNSRLETAKRTGKIAVSSAGAGEAAKVISAYRASHGLGPVTADPGLDRAAQAQARAVAETGTLSHGDFAGRMVAFGIRGGAAENLAAGSDTVPDVVSRWRASPGHDANLLMPEATRIGLARADTPGVGWGRYWALVLAR